jgi:hypothetical protein
VVEGARVAPWRVRIAHRPKAHKWIDLQKLCFLSQACHSGGLAIFFKLSEPRRLTWTALSSQRSGAQSPAITLSRTSVLIAVGGSTIVISCLHPKPNTSFRNAI